MIIIGAGLTGLICGALNPKSIIYEAKSQTEIKSSILRFKTPELSNLLNIPFKKVKVQYGIWYGMKNVNPEIKFCNMYSKKVSDSILSRSIKTGIYTRWIPPTDFVSELKKRCCIKYNTNLNYDDMIYLKADQIPILSTIPLNSMINLCELNRDLKIDFYSKTIRITKIPIENCNIYCTLYYPKDDISVYRVSIHKNELIIEENMIGDSVLIAHQNNLDPILSNILSSFGLEESNINLKNAQTYKIKSGKIKPIDGFIRRKIIRILTQKYGIYQIGRYGTWRPKLMLDEIPNDLKIIKTLINSDEYEGAKYEQAEKN